MENNEKIEVNNITESTNKNTIETKQYKDKDIDIDKNKNSNKIFVIAVITAFLIFFTYIFISSFISHKEKKDVNLTIKLEENIV